MYYFKPTESGVTVLGCFSYAIGKRVFKHGFTKHPIYRHWKSMKERCLNKNCSHYRWYGEKNIKVCQEWINSSESFIKWAFSNNWKKGLTLDRINPRLGYSPENCQFITKSENSKRAILYNKEKNGRT